MYNKHKKNYTALGKEVKRGPISIYIPSHHVTLTIYDPLQAVNWVDSWESLSDLFK